MIARLWRGVVATEKTAEYVEIVERTGMSEYRETPGNLAAQIITRDLGDGRTEIATLSWWTDRESMRQVQPRPKNIVAFAGDPIDQAHYYPEDDDYLIDRDRTVAHYEVAEPAEAGDLLP